MGFILTSEAKVVCPHGGIIQHRPRRAPTQYINNYPIWVIDDHFSIAGCPAGQFCCQRAEWKWGSPTLYLYSKAVLTTDSKGYCYDFGSGQNGPVSILSHQNSILDKP